MKRSLILIAALLLASGCQHRLGTLTGSGNRAMQKRDVAAFTSLTTQGSFVIQVVTQQALSLQIEADDNVLPLISTEVNNGVLRVTTKGNYSTSEPVSVKISVPTLDGLSVSGGGKVDVSGLKNEKFELDSSGAPTIKLAGNAKVLEIDTSGAAKIDTHKLHTSHAVVDSKGVSSIDLDVSDQLDVTISGPSHVSYEGDPVVNKKINGPGTIEKKVAAGA